MMQNPMQNTNPFNGQNGMGLQPSRRAYYGDQQMDSPQVMNPAQQQNWRPYSPEPAMPPLIGKWVKSFDEIRPMDVPNDGSFAFFPQADYSCIYAMVWNNDGRIMPYRFVPEKNDPPAPQQPVEPVISKEAFDKFAAGIDDRLSAFEKRMNDILGPFTSSDEKKG